MPFFANKMAAPSVIIKKRLNHSLHIDIDKKIAELYQSKIINQ